MEELYKLLVEGTLREGDILATGKYDRAENRLPTDKYELVIDSDPANREITVIRQFSNGDIARTKHKSNERSLEMCNLNHYRPGSEEYESWEKRLIELEIWEEKK
jgi:hypothetical protein